MAIRTGDELRVALRDELRDVAAREGLAASVIARHRRGRLRRLAGAAALGIVLAATGVPLGLAATSGRAPVDVNLAAWSVRSGQTATVTVTVRELRDAALLRSVLAEAGVPATVRFGVLCSAPQTLGSAQTARALTSSTAKPSPSLTQMTFTITPSAIPKGWLLNINVVSSGRSFGERTFLYPAGDQLTCTVPTFPHP